MLSPRWRKILRDLWGNKARTALVVLSIAVGVFAVGVIVASQMILGTDLSASYRQTNPAHASLYTNATDETIITVRRLPGVAAAEGRASVRARTEETPDQWRDLEMLVIPDYENMEVTKVLPVAGAREPDEREIFLERASLAELGLVLGDTLLIEMPDGEQRTLTISGVSHDLNIPSAVFNPTLQGYINPATQEWLVGERYFSQIDILIDDPTPTEPEIRAVAEIVKDKIENGGESVRRIYVPIPGKHWADELIQPLLTILVVLGFLTLLLSGFLVVNTISAILAQQVRQIGVMKTIGAETGQLIQMYLATVFIFGLLSLLISIPLGAWSTYAFVNFVANLLNFFAIPFKMPAEALALQIGVGLLVPLLAAIVPIVSGARLTVLQALSSYGLGKGGFGKNPIDHLLERVRGLPRPVLISLRNTFRRKGRLALTLSTLVLGGAIFIAVLSVYSSLMATLDEALAYWNYDLDVGLTRPYRIDQILATAESIPGVVAAESWSGASTRRLRPDGTESNNIFLLAPPAETRMINPRLLAGRWLLPTDENAIVVNSIVLEEDPDIEVGQPITLKLGEREGEWQVVGIVQGVLTGPIMYANYPYFARENRFVGRAGQLQVILDRHDGAYQQQMATLIHDTFEAAGMDVASTETTESIRENVIVQFNILVTFLTIMAVLIAVVGALGLTGTMSINVLERSREVGVMRAIGASDRSVLNIFLTEGILIGLMSWVLGGLLAFPISQALSYTVGIAFLDAPLTYTFSTFGAGLWLILVLILAALSSWWPSWRASRLTVRDVLAYE